MEIVLTKDSKIKNVDFENLEFGKIFTDHLFVCKYSNNNWGTGKIMPYDNFLISPSARVFHYGQAIFEGMKCYRSDNDSLILFRPDENFKRFNKSSTRMAIPEIPKNIFFDGLTELLKIDKDWVKKGDGNALYLRPFVFASEPSINASEAIEYTFMIICCPAKSYYGNQKIKVKIEEKYSRAAKGGVGYAKAAGNYAAQFYPTSIAKEEGYQQIIWTDSNNHKSIEEAGTMNLFFRIGDKLITSPTSDSILDGITRKSIIKLAKDSKIDIEERIITVDELMNAQNKGELMEIFGTGTAVVILPIKTFGYQKNDFNLPDLKNPWSLMLKKKLNDIQYDRSAEYENWKLKIS
tara:strand:+ start:776 stop:1825 length:1050 start_codon:yes stop_codon:yes gene_type:complete